MRRKIEISPEEEHEATTAAPAARTEGPEAYAEAGAEPEGESAPDTGAADYITALQAEIEDLRLRAEEAEKRAIYIQAEFQNFRRRKEEENASLQKYGNAELIKSLLPIVDNFERALAAAEQTKNFEALVGGVTGTLKQMQAFLQKAGVTPIEAVGAEFDPNYHEAIGHTESDEFPANTVAQEIQRGYVMHDRVLRPSLVKVSQG